jgi:hypothetical protein
MDFVVLVAAAHVCDEKIAAEEVLNDEGCGSALPVCRVVRVPLCEALGVEAGRICTPRLTECSLELEQRMSHRDSVPRAPPGEGTPRKKSDKHSRGQAPY